VHMVDDTEENSVDSIVARTSKNKYSEISVKVAEYEQFDYLWRCAKEVEFFSNIIRFRLEFDIHNLVDHIYYWNNVRPLTRHQLILLKVPVDEVTQELDRRAELRRLEVLRKKLAEERKIKRAEMKAKLMELGILTGIPIEQMEQEYEEDEKKVFDSATQVTLMWGLRGLQKKKRKMKLNADGEAVPDSARLSEEGSAKLSEKLNALKESQEGDDEGDGESEAKIKAEENLTFADDEDEEEEEEEEEGGKEDTPKKERKKREKKP